MIIFPALDWTVVVSPISCPAAIARSTTSVTLRPTTRMSQMGVSMDDLVAGAE